MQILRTVSATTPAVTPPSAPAAPTTPKTTTTTTSSTPGGAMGKDQFLQLLVAQMKNQDPDSPMDGTQMAAQLAQFSTVEQLQNANDTLTQIANAVRVANGSTQASTGDGSRSGGTTNAGSGTNGTSATG
ncbi:MAG TPA: flagellar hook capping FlgD N-terminal domain-containing protein [Gemmatirosa sp.]